MSDNKKMFEERLNRVKSTVVFDKTDRVPIAPKIGTMYVSAYGDANMYDVMINPNLYEEGVREFYKQFHPDLAWGPFAYPILPMETLGATYMKWPGGGFGIPLSKGFQILDGTFIEDDEFGELVFDPTNFFMTKLYPRKFKALSGWSKVNLQYPVEFQTYINFLPFADPEVRQSMYNTLVAGEQVAKWFGASMGIIGLIEELGFPVGAKFAVNCPFDMFADNMRGIMKTLEDMHERPEQLMEVLDKLEVITINNVKGLLRMTGAPFAFIPLHNGVDEFMSRENYEKFYWKGLKNLMMAIIEEGSIPFVFCEGKYKTRLDIISDVPKGKVLYQFEETDTKLIKDTVGKVAAFCGNLDTATLMYGSKEQIADETKRIIDIGAPGGGFIMDISIGIDECKLENLDVFFETSLKHGKY